MKAGVSAGRMLANVSLNARATVTTGFGERRGGRGPVGTVMMQATAQGVACGPQQPVAEVGFG